MKRGKTFRGHPFLAAGLLISVLGGEIRFTEVTGSSGLSAAIHGEGVCVFDVNRDGFEDIAIADYDGGNLLYENLGEMTFREVSQDAGIARDLSARLVVAGDYDNDGHPDLFLGAIEGSSILYRNRGDGTFSDVTDEAAVEITVVDVRGRTIQVLVHGRPGPGAHRVAWRGGENATGLYLIRMSAGSREFVRKILFLR